MIQKLITIVLALASFTVTPVRADVIVQDVNNVIIAGANVGKVADACANHPAKRADIQAALETYLADSLAAKAAAEKSLADTRAVAADLIKRAKEAADAGNMQAIRAVIAEGQTPAKERKRAELRAEKAKLTEQVTALETQIAELAR